MPPRLAILHVETTICPTLTEKKTSVPGALGPLRYQVWRSSRFIGLTCYPREVGMTPLNPRSRVSPSLTAARCPFSMLMRLCDHQSDPLKLRSRVGHNPQAWPQGKEKTDSARRVSNQRHWTLWSHALATALQDTHVKYCGDAHRKQFQRRVLGMGNSKSARFQKWHAKEWVLYVKVYIFRFFFFLKKPTSYG